MRSIKNLYTLLTTKEKRNFKLLMVMMFFAMLLETLGIASILPIINLFTNQTNELNFTKMKFLEGYDKQDLILLFSSIIFFIYIIKNLYLALYYFLETKFSYSVRFNLGARLFNYYLSKPYSFHLKKHSAKLITKITQETSLVGSSIMQLSILFTETLIISGIILLLLIIRPFETLIIIFLIFSFGFIFYAFSKKKSLVLGKTLVESQKVKMKILNESLSSVKEIILFNVKNFFSRQFQNISDNVSYLGYKMAFINRLPKIYFEIVLLLIVISIILFSIYKDENTLNIIGTLGIFLISSLKIIPSLNKILVSLQTIKYSQSAVESLKEDVDNIQTVELMRERNIEKNSNIFKTISLKDLSFRHHDKKDFILDNINIDIFPKDFIAIVGKTGSGKTTFINLLTGILEPTQGEILIDGKSLKNNYETLRSLIGYVPQNIFLFDDSIKKNIAFGIEEKDISKEKLKKSVSQAKLTEFVSNLEESYDFKIGENASKISGGQKQRIAIARALYNDPPILILDEPTSSLDKNTSEEILQYLKSLSQSKTIIIITHKLESTSLFSKVFEISDKKISIK